MFFSCPRLKYLDITNFVLDKVSDAQYMFYHNYDLAYLNIYNIKDPQGFINRELLEGNAEVNSLTVCQSGNLVTDTKFKYECKFFTNYTNI